MSGAGCPECARIDRIRYLTRTHDEFIGEAIKIHGDLYGYGKVKYENDKLNVEIICKAHGSFWQTPQSHLDGCGCPKCNRTISKKEINFLNYLNISDTKDHRQVKLEGKKVDGYDPITNTIYEFYGDYWHGNPQLYIQTDMNKAVKKSYGTLYKNTMDRLYFLYNKGYTIKYIWEHDWIKFTKNKVESPLIIDYIPDIYV